MKILFTKSIHKKEIISVLENDLAFDCIDFIKILFLPIQLFNIQDKTLFFSSQNAVKGFLNNGFLFNSTQKIFCIGSKTKNLIEENNGYVTVTEKNAEALLKTIKNENEIIHFCGNLALDTLEKSFREENKNYQKIIVYKTELLYPKLNDTYHAVVFFSPSGVRSFAKFNSFEGKKIFSLGEITTKELNRFTKSKIFSSHENNVKDLLQIIKAETNN